MSNLRHINKKCLHICQLKYEKRKHFWKVPYFMTRQLKKKGTLQTIISEEYRVVFNNNSKKKNEQEEYYLT